MRPYAMGDNYYVKTFCGQQNPSDEELMRVCICAVRRSQKVRNKHPILRVEVVWDCSRFFVICQAFSSTQPTSPYVHAVARPTTVGSSRDFLRRACSRSRPVSPQEYPLPSPLAPEGSKGLDGARNQRLRARRCVV